MEKENILQDVYDFLGRYIWYPNDHYRVAHTAWIVHSYLFEAFYATPRLAILSAEKRSGKTRLLEITKLLVRNPIAMVSPSSASIYSFIEGSDVPPTFLIDEIGRLLERKDVSEFITIVEAGFQPGHTVPRVTLDPVRKVEQFRVYAPILMAGIDNGRMPDTILDRSIVITMRRHIGDKLSYRPRRDAAEGLALAAKIAEWAKTVADKAGEVEPAMPPELNDREQDKWEPMVVVGYLIDAVTPGNVDNSGYRGNIGNNWEDRIKIAAIEISNEDRDIEPSSNSELLLRDIYDVFPEIDRIRTSELLEELNSLDESPWGSYNYGRPLDGRGLARILKPHKIKPKTIRFGKSNDDNDKGYYKFDFKDAWNRYLDKAREKSVTTVIEVSPVTNTFRINVNGEDRILENMLDS